MACGHRHCVMNPQSMLKFVARCLTRIKPLHTLHLSNMPLSNSSKGVTQIPSAIVMCDSAFTLYTIILMHHDMILDPDACASFIYPQNV